MDCYSNNMGCRNECPQSRRSRSYRQTIPVTGRSMPGGSSISCRNQANCRGCLTDVMRASENMPVGMTYTPYQEFSCLYEWDTALDQGTLFSDLNKPFLVTNCSQGGSRL